MTESYAVHSLIVGSGDYGGALMLRTALPGRVTIELPDRAGCRLLLHGNPVTRGALLEWFGRTQRVRAELDRDQARHGLVAEARFHSELPRLQA